VELDDFILACCQEIRMEILSTENGVLMTSQERHEFHCVSVEDLGVVAVSDHDNKVTFVLGFSAWSRILYIDNFVIVTHNGINCRKSLDIDM
jgi:hypothetical protein